MRGAGSKRRCYSCIDWEMTGRLKKNIRILPVALILTIILVYVYIINQSELGWMA